MNGFFRELVKKISFSIVVGVFFLFVSSYFLYLGESISDIFTATFIGSIILLILCLFKFKESIVKNRLLWNFFEIVGYGLFTLILCLATKEMFHHFLFATTALILFFKVVPSIIYSTVFKEKH